MDYQLVFKKLIEAEGAEALDEASEVASLRIEAEEAAEICEAVLRVSQEEPTYFITT